MANKEVITIHGYAAKFNAPYRFGSFWEDIAPDALKKADLSNVKLLRDHEAGTIVASVTAGTLKVSIDKIGIYFAATLPDTNQGRDIAVLVEKRIITQCSWGFQTKNGDGSQWLSTPNGTPVRRIVDVAKVFDISLCTFPANENTSVSILTKQPPKNNIMQQLPATTATPMPDSTAVLLERVKLREQQHTVEYAGWLNSQQQPQQQPQQRTTSHPLRGFEKAVKYTPEYECAGIGVMSEKRTQVQRTAAQKAHDFGLTPGEISERCYKKAQQVGGDLWAKMQQVYQRESDLAQICEKDRDFLRELNNGRR